MLRTLATATRLVVFFSLLTGLAYPVLVTALAYLLFPAASQGSLIRRGDGANARVVGSALIGQATTAPDRFWGRPSVTAPVPTTAFDSGARTGGVGSNDGPESDALRVQVTRRVAALHAAERAAGVAADGPVPVDLVTASASGLDPHLSVAGARYQVPRVAALLHVAPARLYELIDACTVRSATHAFGPPVVGVLRLNLALRALLPP